MPRRRLVLSLVALATAVAALVLPAPGDAAAPCRTDWPAYQHDTSRTGATCSAITPANVTALSPAWFLPTAGEVTAEPAVVGSRLYVGDGSGVMHAVDRRTGKDAWTFDVTANRLHNDRHEVSYSEITSSAAVADVPRLGRTVFFGGGGTVYALDAATGRPRWAADLDPTEPTGPTEVESSPVVWVRPGRDATVFVGDDTNEAKAGAPSGVVALDARTGRLRWKYDAQSGRVVHDLRAGAHSSNACGDVWSSPALDAARGLLFFTTGNCKLADGRSDQRVVAVRARDGSRVWTFSEPAGNHGADDDFGAAPVLATLRGRPVLVQAGKSGWVYVVDRRTGRRVRQVLAAQPGQVRGAIGGFIGSVAVGTLHGRPLLFGNSAVPAPLTDDDHGSTAPDTSLAADPTRASSLHAVDLATGRVLWHAPQQLPAYAPVTYSNGVVFAPSTAGFSFGAYDAATGVRLAAFPVAGAPSGGATVSRDSVYFGTGTYFSASAPVPPQVTGLWCLTLPAPPTGRGRS